MLTYVIIATGNLVTNTLVSQHHELWIAREETRSRVWQRITILVVYLRSADPLSMFYCTKHRVILLLLSATHFYYLSKSVGTNLCIPHPLEIKGQVIRGVGGAADVEE